MAGSVVGPGQAGGAETGRWQRGSSRSSRYVTPHLRPPRHASGGWHPPSSGRQKGERDPAFAGVTRKKQSSIPRSISHHQSRASRSPHPEKHQGNDPPPEQSCQPPRRQCISGDQSAVRRTFTHALHGKAGTHGMDAHAGHSGLGTGEGVARGWGCRTGGKGLSNAELNCRDMNAFRHDFYCHPVPTYDSND